MDAEDRDQLRKSLHLLEKRRKRDVTGLGHGDVKKQLLQMGTELGLVIVRHKI